MSERDNWRPISTAPKDGTAILIYAKYISEGPISAKYIKRDEYDPDDHWINIYDNNQIGDEFITHWKPLPNPPEEGSDA